MKHNKKIFALLLLVVLLMTSCVSRLREVSSNTSLKKGIGYISAELFDSNFYIFGFLPRNSPYSIVLQNKDTGGHFNLPFILKDDMKVFDLPTGEYRIIRIYKKVYNLSGKSRTRIVNIPEELQGGFTVEESKITYIGDLKIVPEKKLILKIDKTEFTYDLESAKESISKKYTNLKSDDVISFQ